MPEHMFRSPKQFVVTIALGSVLAVLILLTLSVREPDASSLNGSDTTQGGIGGAAAFAPAAYNVTPTPDPTPMGWQPPGATSQGQTHTVSAGETLGYIADLYGRTVAEFVTANQLTDPDRLDVGQVLIVPGDAAGVTTPPLSPSLKLIPDSELVYGPTARGFSVRDFLAQHSGYLSQVSDRVEGQTLSGVDIVQLVADRYSVHPRLLLAALEYRSGWVTQTAPLDDGYPMGLRQPGYEGLYRQLEWAANQLNRGYYGRIEGGLTQFTLSDGTLVIIAPDINPGTVAVQLWLGVHSQATYAGWLGEAGPDGFLATYTTLFGNPFGYTYEPIWSGQEVQPVLRLPWEDGVSWHFTGGPHGGYAGGSAWAALDFAPPDGQGGCYESSSWLTAAASGLVTRSSFGAVVIDLDGDGFAGTGWALHFLHVAGRERVAVGTTVRAGDRIGHPSCEGGVSNGTHVHFARTFNGRWIAADGQTPFNLSGWVSAGLGSEYDGVLQRSGVIKTACACREDSNTLTAEP